MYKFAPKLFARSNTKTILIRTLIVITLNFYKVKCRQFEMEIFEKINIDHRLNIIIILLKRTVEYIQGAVQNETNIKPAQKSVNLNIKHNRNKYKQISLNIK